MISVIVPTSFRYRSRRLLSRLIRLIDFGPFEKSELIISHGDTGCSMDKKIYSCLDQRSIHYVTTPVTSERLSIAQLRNAGAEVATSDYLLFFDVDLWASNDVFNRLRSQVENGQLDFLIIPCLYLTQAGSRRLKKVLNSDCGEFLEYYYSYRRNLIAFLALNTSTILVRRDIFRGAEGFTTSFFDHGLEDFEFLLKVAIRNSEYYIPRDIIVDQVTHSIAFAKGFRAFLNLFSLPVFVSELFTLHFWHSRSKMSQYFNNRDRNRLIFNRSVQEVVDSVDVSGRRDYRHLVTPAGNLDSLLVAHHFIGKGGKSDRDYSALFDNNPQINFQPNRIGRKISKVFREKFAIGTSRTQLKKKDRFECSGGSANNRRLLSELK